MSKSGVRASSSAPLQYLWQMENWSKLILYWYETEDSKAIERNLRQLYREEYSVLPLANRI